jgi:hypothetical protein
VSFAFEKPVDLEGDVNDIPEIVLNQRDIHPREDVRKDGLHQLLRRQLSFNGSLEMISDAPFKNVQIYRRCRVGKPDSRRNKTLIFPPFSWRACPSHMPILGNQT